MIWLHHKLPKENDSFPFEILRGGRKGKSIEEIIKANENNNKRNSNTGEENNTALSIRSRVRTQGVKRKEWSRRKS